MFTVCHSLSARQPLPVDGFYEDHFKYGSMYVSYSGSSRGYPPALSKDENGRFRVCEDYVGSKEARYKKIVSRAIDLITQVLRTGNAIPELNPEYTLRTPYDSVSLLSWSLQTKAYYMQEYLAGGWEHPLYLVARSKTLDEFEKALNAYEGEC